MSNPLGITRFVREAPGELFSDVLEARQRAARVDLFFAPPPSRRHHPSLLVVNSAIAAPKARETHDRYVLRVVHFRRDVRATRTRALKLVFQCFTVLFPQALVSP